MGLGKAFGVFDSGFGIEVIERGIGGSFAS